MGENFLVLEYESRPNRDKHNSWEQEAREWGKIWSGKCQISRWPWRVSLSGKGSGLVIAAECVTIWASFAKPWWSRWHSWWWSHNLERYIAGGNERFHLTLPKAVPEPGTEISVNLEGMWTNEFCDIIPKYTTAIRKINHCRCTYMSPNLRKIDFLGTLGGV